MHLSQPGIPLVLFLAGVMAACAHTDTRPEDLSAAEHQARASEALHMARLEESAARKTPGTPRQYGPDPVDKAAALRSHAQAHAAAARELLNFEAQECAGIDIARGSCPLLEVDRVEELPDGVILRLNSNADLHASLHLIQCYLAYGRAQAFKGEPGCPFYVRGVHVLPLEEKRALRLVAMDEASAAMLKQLIYRAFRTEGDADEYRDGSLIQ